MSVWYTLMDPRFGAYPGPKMPGTVGNTLGSAAGKLPLVESIRMLSHTLRASIVKAAMRRQAMRELHALDDRLLADIGLTRENITAAVKGAMTQQHAIALGARANADRDFHLAA